MGNGDSGNAEAVMCIPKCVPHPVMGTWYKGITSRLHRVNPGPIPGVSTDRSGNQN